MNGETFRKAIVAGAGFAIGVLAVSFVVGFVSTVVENVNPFAFWRAVKSTSEAVALVALGAGIALVAVIVKGGRTR